MNAVEAILSGPPDRALAFQRLEAELCRGAVVGDAGVAAATSLADALFAPVPPKDPILVARALGRLTLGYVDWLEIHGADGVGTRARNVLAARRADVGRLVQSSDEASKAAGIWLATVAGFFDVVVPSDGSLASWLFEAARARKQRLLEPDASARFMERADEVFEGSAAREIRLCAGLAACIANPELGSYLSLDGRKDAFFGSVPEDLVLETFPFRLGRLGELTHAVGELTSCPPWEREKAGDDPHWRWDPEARAVPIEPPAESSEPIDAEETNPYMLDRPSRGVAAYELTNLDSVDWRSLEDAYGHAAAVPKFLQALASMDASEREWGLHSLFAGINHQGGTFSASVAAVPFLVRLALEPRVPERQSILGLLVGLATGEPQWALLELEFPTLCSEAISNEVGRLVPLLEDDDPAVRGKAIHLLGHLEAKRDEISLHLADALTRETDPYLRASLLMAMARVTRRCKDTELLCRVHEAGDILARESELGRAVAALCPYYEREELTVAERTALSELDRVGYSVHPSYAWNRGNIAGHARAIHGVTMPVEDALAALERGERDLRARAQQLLFPVSTWKKHELFLPEEMSPDQMRFLRWAVKVPQAYYETFWRDSGLPNTEPWLARFVGDAPLGALDRRVRVTRGEWPIWKVLHNVMTDRLQVDEWKRLASEWSDDELLAVYDEAIGREFLLDAVRDFIDSLDDESVASSKRYRDRFYRLLLDAVIVRPELVRRFEERADAFLSKPVESASYRDRTLLFAGLGLAAKQRGGELEPRHAKLAEPGDWSPAMRLITPLRWGLERLPLSLRWDWFRGMLLVSLTRVEDVRGVRHKVRIHDGWAFLDLVPTREAFDAVAEAFRVLDRHARGEDDEQHERGLTSGPLVTWDEDDELPRAALTDIARAWGPLWEELLVASKAELSPALWQELRDAG